MTPRDLRFGLVGAGGIAQTYAQVFQDQSCGRIVGVADTRGDAARAVAEVLGCASYDSAVQLADSVSLDAVIVCTPPDSHPKICRLFLERSVHVLCEKPLSTDVAGATELLAAARRSGKTLAMASKFRYVEDVVQAKSILLSGILGKPYAMRVTFRSPVDMSGRWNSNAAVSGGGALIDNGTHAVDLVRYLVGPIQEVFAAEGRRLRCLPVEETVQVVCRTADGLLATLDLSWSVPDVARDYVQIACSGGGLRMGWKESGYRRLPTAEWVCFGRGYRKLQAIHRQVENFARAVVAEEPLLISEEDALASAEVIAAGYRSLSSGRWETVATGVQARQAVA